MESRGQIDLGTNESKKSQPEVRRELRTPIRDNVIRKSMEMHHLLENKQSSLLRGDVLVAGQEMGHFRESIHHNQNGVKTTRNGKISDEIHGNRLPLVTGDQQREESSIWFVARNL